MRSLFSSLAALAVVAAAAFPALAADALSAPIDQSVAVALPPGAQNVMVGNPAIADVSILDARSAVVLGRSYGVTNLLVLDGRGRTLMDRQILVSAADTGRITAIRGGPAGARVENYACATRCERVPMPGELDIDYNRYAPGYNGYSARTTEGRASGGAKPGP